MRYNEENIGKGITNIEINGEIYTVWIHAKVVKKHIKDYLRKRFPDKIIVREFDNIDYVIPEENMPIEIQSTMVEPGAIKYSAWENHVRKQIEQNIINHGRCLFFFDDALLRAMQNTNKNMSINMDWFRKLMKEEKLKVFTVTYDGIIQPKEYKDFNFLSEKSQTCPIAAETDKMVLTRNKMKIFYNATKLYSFNQEEIDRFESDFEEYCNINRTNDRDESISINRFLMRQIDDRAKLYGRMSHSIANLQGINRIFDGDIIRNHGLSDGVYIGVFESKGIISGAHDNRMKFVDRSGGAQYFPGYIRHKDKWDEFKGKWLTSKQFEGIIKGNVDYNWYKNYENTDNSQDQKSRDQINNEIGQNQINDDKEVNIKIYNKDHTININIKTKQKTIEDAWS